MPDDIEQVWSRRGNWVGAFFGLASFVILPLNEATQSSQADNGSVLIDAVLPVLVLVWLGGAVGRLLARIARGR